MVVELTDILRKQLETDPAIICFLDERLRITYCNPSWDRFASENGGRGLERDRMAGRPYMAVIPVPLQQFFEEGFERVLKTRQVWEHSYECSSPEMYRIFRMTTFPDPGSLGLVVVNSLAVERPHDAAERLPHGADAFVYVNSRNRLTMCCHCRRTCRAREPMVWDWVPAYLKSTPGEVTHGICTVCMTLYYPDYIEQ